MPVGSTAADTHATQIVYTLDEMAETLRTYHAHCEEPNRHQLLTRSIAAIAWLDMAGASPTPSPFFDHEEDLIFHFDRFPNHDAQARAIAMGLTALLTQQPDTRAITVPLLEKVLNQFGIPHEADSPLEPARLLDQLARDRDQISGKEDGLVKEAARLAVHIGTLIAKAGGDDMHEAAAQRVLAIAEEIEHQPQDVDMQKAWRELQAIGLENLPDLPPLLMLKLELYRGELVNLRHALKDTETRERNALLPRADVSAVAVSVVDLLGRERAEQALQAKDFTPLISSIETLLDELNGVMGFPSQIQCYSPYPIRTVPVYEKITQAYEATKAARVRPGHERFAARSASV
ncbi:hypothetical protein [Bordetella sp. LUAb4]|uniref:hypothetical protein n=1 Tax=Bordetella sp. LUAb4 TaxID=2843195 RepID=UPI001E32FC31|nr:hypothetical protein [Bordetella sp. LUAb4]